MKENTMRYSAFTQEDIEQNKVISGLGYIIFFLPLLVMNRSKFARFHANQILILYIFSIIANLLLGILSAIMIAAAPLLGVIISVAMLVVDVAIGIVAVINMVAAFQGKAKRIPLLGRLTIISGSNDMEAEEMIHNDKINHMADSIQNFSVNSVAVRCPNCGNMVLGNKNFCTKCGAPVVREQKVQGQPEVQTPANVKPQVQPIQPAMPAAEAKPAYICRNCQNTVPDGMKFCPECGTAVEKEPEWKCTNCGTAVKEGTKFCPECGTKISGV